MRTWALAVVAAIAGFATGWLGRPSPAPAPAPPARCEEELALAEALVAASVQAEAGTALVFPDDLPATLRPDRFEDAVRTAVAACPDAGLALVTTDCAEYPCLASFAAPGGGTAAVADLRSCPAWKATLPGKVTSRSTWLMTDDGPREWVTLTVWPDGAPAGARDRVNFRTELARGRLSTAAGARPLTRVEELARQRAVLADEGGSAEHLRALDDEIALYRATE